MSLAKLPVYPPGSYNSADIRIMHDSIECPCLSKTVARLEKLRQEFSPQHIVFAYDCLAPCTDEKFLAQAFIELGGTIQPCSLGYNRFIDFRL